MRSNLVHALVIMSLIFLDPTAIYAQIAQVTNSDGGECYQIQSPNVASGSPYSMCLGGVVDLVARTGQTIYSHLGGTLDIAGSVFEPSDLGNSDKPSNKEINRIFLSVQCMKTTCDSNGCRTDPVPNCGIQFKFIPQPGGGSHNPVSTEHPVLRPRGEIAKATQNNSTTTATSGGYTYTFNKIDGELNDRNSTPNSASLIYKENSDSSGNPVNLVYTLPEVSGLVTIEITSFLNTSDQFTFSTPLTIEIKDLLRKSSYTAPNGGAWAMSSVNGDSHHYLANNAGISSVFGAMNDGVTGFAEELNKLNIPNEIIHINEISLPQGGMFDLNGYFYTLNTKGNGHITHRRGIEVDFALASTYVKQVLEQKNMQINGFEFRARSERLADCVIASVPVACRKAGVSHFHGVYKVSSDIVDKAINNRAVSKISSLPSQL